MLKREKKKDESNLGWTLLESETLLGERKLLGHAGTGEGSEVASIRLSTNQDNRNGAET